MSVFTDLTIRKKGNFNHQFDLNQSPLKRESKISIKILNEFFKNLLPYQKKQT